MKVLKSEGYLIALLSFPPGINSAREIGSFTSRAPASSLKQRVLFCKCQILMGKDTISLRPQNLGLRDVNLHTKQERATAN